MDSESGQNRGIQAQVKERGQRNQAKQASLGGRAGKCVDQNEPRHPQTPPPTQTDHTNHQSGCDRSSCWVELVLEPTVGVHGGSPPVWDSVVLTENFEPCPPAAARPLREPVSRCPNCSGSSDTPEVSPLPRSRTSPESEGRLLGSEAEKEKARRCWHVWFVCATAIDCGCRCFIQLSEIRLLPVDITGTPGPRGSCCCGSSPLPLQTPRIGPDGATDDRGAKSKRERCWRHCPTNIVAAAAAANGGGGEQCAPNEPPGCPCTNERTDSDGRSAFLAPQDCRWVDYQCPWCVVTFPQKAARISPVSISPALQSSSPCCLHRAFVHLIIAASSSESLALHRPSRVSNQIQPAGLGPAIAKVID